jgi:hypothetical protein
LYHDSVKNLGVKNPAFQRNAFQSSAFQVGWLVIDLGEEEAQELGITSPIGVSKLADKVRQLWEEELA